MAGRSAKLEPLFTLLVLLVVVVVVDFKCDVDKDDDVLYVDVINDVTVLTSVDMATGRAPVSPLLSIFSSSAELIQ